MIGFLHHTFASHTHYWLESPDRDTKSMNESFEFNSHKSLKSSAKYAYTSVQKSVNAHETERTQKCEDATVLPPSTKGTESCQR